MAAFRKNEVYAGRYQLDALIGEGGFSEVWRAKDEMTEEALVALKIYAPQKGLDEYGIKQFRKEYSITYNLSHSHLMKVLYFDICEGSPFLIMPYYKSGSLSTYLQEKGPFNEKQIALLMQQIGGALEELHTQDPQILHQDIKPDNILVKNDDHFVLTDFGISSKTRQTLRKATGTSYSLTLAYAPPERFESTPVSNQASDIFSLGITLYEMCTGTLPWDGNGGVSLLKGARVPELPVSFPRELNKMIQACMSLEWDKRPDAKILKNWGKFYLENGYWKYRGVNSRKGLYFKIAAVLLILGVMGIASSVLLNSTDNQEKAVVNSSISASQIAEKKVPTEEKPLVIKETEKPSIKPEEPAIKPTDATLAPKTSKITEDKNPVISENREPTLLSRSQTDVDNNPVINKEPTTEKEFPQPQGVEEYLNQISNRDIPREVRKEWIKEALSLFASDSAVVFEKKDGYADKTILSNFLNLLLDIPHKVKVLDAMEDENRKISELHIESSLVKARY